MRKVFSISLALVFICAFNLSAKQKVDLREKSISTYLHMLEEHDLLVNKGDYKNNEIEIVTNIKDIKEIENLQKKRLLNRGFSLNQAILDSRVGIIAEDNYWIWIRDAVVFPSKAKGTYNRMIWKSSIGGPVGVAIMPILSDGKIVLNLNYRHATRSWELELPRGKRAKEESAEQTAIRELKEETGLQLDRCIFLGEVTPDTGLVSSVVPVFAGKVCLQGKKNMDFSEAILCNPAFTKEEIKKACVDGFITVTVDKKDMKIILRDVFLFYAIFCAEVKGLL